MSVSETLRCLIPPVSSGPGLPPLVARARLKMGAGGRSGARSAGRQWSSDSDQERIRVSRERELCNQCAAKIYTVRQYVTALCDGVLCITPYPS